MKLISTERGQRGIWRRYARGHELIDVITLDSGVTHILRGPAKSAGPQRKIAAQPSSRRTPDAH